MTTLPTTKERVPKHTARRINEQLQRKAEERVRFFEGRSSLIPSRMKELEAEWDIERAIEANAATLAFIGVVLGYFVHPYWLALPALVTLFLFQHAVQGWCPPVPVLRRLGFRTVYEIERERHALKALRGDFAGVTEASDKAGAALQAAA